MGIQDLLNTPQRMLATRDGVEALLEHAYEIGDKNLALFCKAWLDPASEKAKAYAEDKIRKFIETGKARL